LNGVSTGVIQLGSNTPDFKATFLFPTIGAETQGFDNCKMLIPGHKPATAAVRQGIADINIICFVFVADINIFCFVLVTIYPFKAQTCWKSR